VKKLSELGKIQQVRNSLPADIDERLGSQAIDSRTGKRVIVDTIRIPLASNKPESIDVVDGSGVSHERQSRHRFRILK
jgi:hypothetical protein